MICPECHGNGFLQGDDGQIDCPMCVGSGEIQMRISITLEAGNLINGARAETHGPVDGTFENIGAVWAG